MLRRPMVAVTGLFTCLLVGGFLFEDIKQPRLIAGREYYFDESPVHGYYASSKYSASPLTPEAAEKSDYLRIGVVRQDQRIDHETTYIRARTPFPLDPAHFSQLSPGPHFYRQSTDFTLVPLSLGDAIHSEVYVKVEVKGGVITNSQLVTTPRMSVIRTSYWPNGNEKNSVGYNRDGSVITQVDIDSEEQTGEPSFDRITGKKIE